MKSNIWISQRLFFGCAIDRQGKRGALMPQLPKDVFGRVNKGAAFDEILKAMPRLKNKDGNILL